MATSYTRKAIIGSLALVHESCSGFKSTHEAVNAVFMSAAVFAGAIESRRSESFGNLCFLQDVISTSDPCEPPLARATFPAYILFLIDTEYMPFLPQNKENHHDSDLLCKPLVLHQLLES